MSQVIEEIVDFREHTGLPVNRHPKRLPHSRAQLQLRLINEEVTELDEAIENASLQDIADALGDLIVVTVGAMCEYGLPIERVMNEIYVSNMSKLDDDMKPVYRADGKLLKGPNFRPPDFSFLGES